MTVVIVGHHEEVDALIERRRALGQDGADEVWEGVYHMAPHASSAHADVAAQVSFHLHSAARAAGYRLLAEFNLGDGPANFRVPDFGVVDKRDVGGMYLPSAVMVGEIRSPDDETYDKFTFYAQHGVHEIVVVDPIDHTVKAFFLTTQPPGSYHPSNRIHCCEISCARLAELIDWP